jgi:hypothetical protein
VRAVRSQKLASQMISRAPKGRSKVTNGRQLFIDGDARLKVSRRFRDVLASIATDLGGVDGLSEGQKQIARRCAMLSVECEIMESAAVAGQPFDLDAYGQLTDRLGRAFQRLGLKRVMHEVTPDLGAYLTATAAGKSQDGGLGAIAASDVASAAETATGGHRRRYTSMTPFVTMRRALSDEHLLGGALGGDSWLAWRVLLIAAMGEPLTDEERAIFAKLTGREREPGERVDELWCVIGRRGGKSRAVAALLVYLATMVDYRSQLVLGERGVVLCLARARAVSGGARVRRRRHRGCANPGQDGHASRRRQSDCLQSRRDDRDRGSGGLVSQRPRPDVRRRSG